MLKDALPDEYKQKEKVQAGKKGRQKQLEQAGGTVTIAEELEVPVESWAENGSIPSKKQEYEDFESINRPNVKSAAEMYNKLQNELKSTKQKLEEERKSILFSISSGPHTKSITERKTFVNNLGFRSREIPARLLRPISLGENLHSNLS